MQGTIVAMAAKMPEVLLTEYGLLCLCPLPEPGGIPYDGVPNEEVVSVSLGLAVVFFILATAGILFALACIIFNFVYRKKM